MRLELLAGAMTLLSALPYLRDTIHGATRPQRTSWAVFAVVAAVAAVAQLSSQSIAGGLLALGSAIGFSAIAVASLWYGVGGCSRGDVTALVMLAAGLVLWVITDEALVAIGVAIAVDVPAVALTVRKAATAPHTETMATWVIDGGAGLVSLAAVADVQPALLLYPAYHVVANMAVVAAIRSGRASAQRDPSAP